MYVPAYACLPACLCLFVLICAFGKVACIVILCSTEQDSNVYHIKVKASLNICICLYVLVCAWLFLFLLICVCLHLWGKTAECGGGLYDSCLQYWAGLKYLPQKGFKHIYRAFGVASFFMPQASKASIINGNCEKLQLQYRRLTMTSVDRRKSYSQCSAAIGWSWAEFKHFSSIVRLTADINNTWCTAAASLCLFPASGLHFIQALSKLFTSECLCPPHSDGYHLVIE